MYIQQQQPQPGHTDLVPGGSPGESNTSNVSNISNSGNVSSSSSSSSSMHPLHHQHHHLPNHRFHHHLNSHHHQSDTSGVDTDHNSICSTSGGVSGGGSGMLGYSPDHHQHHHPHLSQQQQGIHHMGVPSHHPVVYYPGNPMETTSGLPASAGEGTGVVMGTMGSQDESSVEAQQRDQRLRTLLADQQQQQQQQHMASSCSMSSPTFCNTYSENGSRNDGCSSRNLTDTMNGSSNSELLFPFF